MNTLLIAINSKYIHTNPAVLSIAAFSSSRGININISEYTINMRYEEIFNDIYIKKPEFIGFSCYIWNISYVSELIVELKKVLPDTKIWLGGPEVSFEYEKVLRKLPVDGIMIGEGEATLHELLKSYEDKTDLSNIDGLAYLKDNKLVVTKCRNEINMDMIENYYIDKTDAYKNRIIYYESSRGCPYNCTYCMSSIDKHVRYRSIEKVKNDIDFFISNKVPQVKFIDRTFNSDKKRAVEIWKYIREKDIGLTNFHFEIAAELIDDNEMEVLTSLRNGLIQLEIGVQTTNETTLKEIKRYEDYNKLSSVMKNLISCNNINCHLDLICGLPYEGIESFKKSFNDIYCFHPHQLQLGFLKVLKGTYIFENADLYDIKYMSVPPYEVLSTKWINYDEILLLKNIENVLEIYYNSRQFVLSIRYIEHFFNNSFDMYLELSRFFIKNKDMVTQARFSYYKLLDEFVKNILDNEQYMCFLQMITFDLYCREKMKKRPDFCKKPDSDDKRALKSINEDGNKHIEFFDIDLFMTAENGIAEYKKNYIVFDYEKRGVIDNNVSYEKFDSD